MDYKRAESFRHALKSPVEMEYSCLVEDVAVICTGKIIDISPSGLRIITATDITADQVLNPIKFTFCLHSKELQLEGSVRWKKYHAEGFLSGVELETTEEIETLIIEELKARRKQEIADLSNSKKL